MLKESKGRKILSLSKVSVLIMVIILVLSVIGSVQAKELVFKLGHVLTAEHSWGLCSSGFAEEVTKRTEGRVTIKVYHNSQLGNEKDMIEGLQLVSLMLET